MILVLSIALRYLLNKYTKKLKSIYSKNLRNPLLAKLLNLHFENNKMANETERLLI